MRSPEMVFSHGEPNKPNYRVAWRAPEEHARSFDFHRSSIVTHGEVRTLFELSLPRRDG